MKKIIVILLSIAFTSCHVSKKDKLEFKDYFFYRVSVIVNYNNLVENGEDIHLNDWMVFLENCSYLETLTGCNLNFIDSEPPYYECPSQLSKDTANLSNWYNHNGDKWTMQKADKYVYKKRKGHSVFF